MHSNWFEFDEDIRKARDMALKVTAPALEQVEEVLFHNQQKVLSAFIEEKVGDYHFAGTTGYGFGDSGREALSRVWAGIFDAESALVRHNIVSGTHALSIIMRGNLLPGQEILCATGDPYDTIKPVLGLDKKWEGGLDRWGITTRVVPLGSDDMPNVEEILKTVGPDTGMVFLQRSCGYTWRPSFDVKTLGEVIRAVKKKKPDVIVMVDNCYGEMVETLEPTSVGADVMGGSLIKNMGGAVAPTGGYVVGKKHLVEGAARALTCPGIGGDEGATMGISRLLFQGTFFAPLIVSQALKGVIWASAFLEEFGLETKPSWNEPRTDIILGVRLGSIEKQKVFCRGIQQMCPVDSTAVPEAASLPGYRDPIIMAGGTFIQGSSIELSCDGPIRWPHGVYLQGGISFAHVQLGVMRAVESMRREGLL